MAINQPPTITPGPTAPQRGDKSTFSSRVDAFVTWLIAVVSQFAAVATNVYNNALEAMGYATAAGSSATASAASAQAADASARNSADSATAAGVISGATLWASGQTVAQDAAKISPLDRRTYRRKTASGSGTTDPSLDTANYVLLSADSSSYIKLAEATISSAVANIDFLNLFSDAYIGYVIELIGVKVASSGTLSLRIAAGGAVDSSSSYRQGGNMVDSMGFLSTGSTEEISITLQIRGARTTGTAKSISGVGASSSSNAGPFIYGWVNSAVASGFRVFVSTGANISAGTIKVYGIRA